MIGLLVLPRDDLQAAVSTAPDDSRIVLAPGIHRGPLRIDRRVTLVGEPGAELRGNGRGTVLHVAAAGAAVRDLAIRSGGGDATRGDAGVLVTADGVRLESLDIADVLVGVDFRGAAGCELRDSTIRGREEPGLGLRGDGIRLWEADGNTVEGNTLTGVRDLVVWYSERNRIVGNRVSGSRYGTHFMHADESVVRDNVYDDVVVGIFVMYSTGLVLSGNEVRHANGAAGVGLGFKDSDDVLATDNRLVDNTTGIYVDATPHRIDGAARFEDNVIAYNDTGVRFHGAQSGARFQGNDFHENARAVAVDGRADTSGVAFEGNRWSDYAGYDLAGDGVGDVPYELRAASVTLLATNPSVGFFHGTLAAGLLDLFAAAFPMFAPPPIARDPRPVAR